MLVQFPVNSIPLPVKLQENITKKKNGIKYKTTYSWIAICTVPRITSSLGRFLNRGLQTSEMITFHALITSEIREVIQNIIKCSNLDVLNMSVISYFTVISQL